MSAETDILRALFAAGTAPSGQGAWSAFLGRLAGETGADSALLQVVRQGQVRQTASVGVPVAVPPVEDLARMRTGRLYSHLDLPGVAAPPPLRAIRCALEDEGFAVLLLARRGRDFRAADGAQLARLQAHLGQVVSIRAQLEADRARAALDRRAAAGLGLAWLRLAPSGRVLEHSAQTGPVAGLRFQANGWPEFAEAEAARCFRQALAAVQAGEAAAPVDISRDPPVQMVVLSHDFGAGPALAAILRQVRSARDLPPERIAATFGLSRSETRLAALLCDGFSLQDAAGHLGWTIGTARSCSKQVFTRMGVRGQPGVVRRMLTSLVWPE